MGYGEQILSSLGNDAPPAQVYFKVYTKMYEHHFPDGYGDGRAFWQKVYGVLSPGERAVFFGNELFNEFHNGGFDQYFLNGNYEHAHETVRMMRHVGATRIADFLQRAIDIVGIPNPLPPNYEYEVTDEISGALEKWEKENRHADRSQRPFAELEDVLARYIREHVAEFA
jgi:hypothetical protein